MDDSSVLAKFLKQCPFAVLTQSVIRGLMRSEFDAVFEENRSQQYEKKLIFSTVAMAVADVTLRFADNFRQAHTKHKEKLRVSLTSFYNKINAIELQTSEAIVARSAKRAADLQDQLNFVPYQVLEGYNVYALDGNHLQESEKRLKPLRMLHDAPLAGTIVARFDLQRQLFDRAYLLEDAHAQECTTLDRVLDDLNEGDLLLADRHYCILNFLRKANDNSVCFVIRQHGRFKGVLVGKRRRIGRTETGVVFEQQIKTSDAADALVMRRITVELDEPTRDGDTVIHLLTNLPKAVKATEIADVYRFRWDEETGFYYLTTTLTCEVKSVSEPKAALFLFCMAMMAFNVRQTVFAALYAEHSEELVNDVSHHAISVEVSQYTDGMLVVLDDAFWDRVLGPHMEHGTDRIREISRAIDLSKYRKSKRGPKKKVEKPPRTRKRTHVSTAKILAQAKNQTP
ncbi:MAG: transposase [Planctomycetales bacterium]|nr:transposase [Planctomycetales bacterium]